MKDTDIQKQLDIMHEEIRNVNAFLSRLRPEDIRTVFGDQTKPILMEWIERFFQQRAQKVGKTKEDTCLKARLIEAVEGTDRAVRGEGRDEAKMILNQLEGDFVSPSSANDPDRRRFVLDLIRQARWYIEESDRMIWIAGEQRGPAITDTGPLSPGTVEETLVPLANSLRLRIMLILSKEEERLVDLCRAMEMQKGHIQYHLKTLMGRGYIRYDCKSRLYSLTGRGTVALDGLAKLTDDILSA